MRMLAVAIKEQTMQSRARIAPMSWEDHIRFVHVPYRKVEKIARPAKKLFNNKSLIDELGISKLARCLWMLLAPSRQPMTLVVITLALGWSFGVASPKRFKQDGPAAR